jgi:hypothetical protein
LRGQHEVQAQLWGISYTIYVDNFCGLGGRSNYESGVLLTPDRVMLPAQKSVSCHTPPKLILLNILLEHFIKALFLSRKIADTITINNSCNVMQYTIVQ